MRPTCAMILAAGLITAGLLLAGGVVLRVWQDGRAAATPVVSATLDLGRNTVAVESGGMALTTVSPPESAPVAAADAATIEPIVTEEPCPPALATGPAVDTQLKAIGIVRLYPDADLSHPPVADFTAGIVFTMTADADGNTAIKRCDLIWYHIRTADAVQGWLLADAVDEIIPRPTVVPTAIQTESPCPNNSGCPNQGCVQPCPNPCNPCNSPCNNRSYYPCSQPCGNYPCSSQGGYNGQHDQSGESYDSPDSGYQQQACGDAECSWTYSVNPNP